VEAKRTVLEYVVQAQLVDSADLASALGYTRAGAASTLLRLHRHGHLLRRRRADAGGFEYAISEKGEAWLRWAEGA
jgi:predicted transcriptional regulator